MISDLLKILQAIQSSSSAEEKARLEQELLTAVESDINALFDDPKYPKRRRTFGAIRRALGIFDDGPQRLKEILYNMGARPVSGEGDEAYWELKKAVARMDSGGSVLPDPPDPGRPFA